MSTETPDESPEEMMCPVCEGHLFCVGCSGSGFQRDGEVCDRCDGFLFCVDCNGDGVVRTP